MSFVLERRSIYVPPYLLNGPPVFQYLHDYSTLSFNLPFFARGARNVRSLTLRFPHQIFEALFIPFIIALFVSYNWPL